MKPKPGINTSELWLIVATGLVGTVLAVLDKVEGEYVMVGGTILGSLYTLLRASAKHKAASLPEPPRAEPVEPGSN